jgi:hypothetical protein
MPVYTEAVKIEGSQDEVQLRVQGVSGQTEALQSWEDSNAVEKARIGADGRLQVGNLGFGSADALVEAHRDSSSGLPKRGIHSLGEVAADISDNLNWIFGELQLIGSLALNGLQRALRARISFNGTGDASAAELRAGDFEAVNQAGSSQNPLGKAVGLQTSVDNQADAFLNQGTALSVQIHNGSDAEIATARAIEILEPLNEGDIELLIGLDVHDIEAGAENYAIRTHKGRVQVGDVLELAQRSNAPGGLAGLVRLYQKNGELFAQVPAGDEYNLLKTVPVQQALLTVEGSLAVALHPLRLYNVTGLARSIQKIFLAVSSAPFGSDIEVDILKDGTSIFTSSPKPKILDGQFTGQVALIDLPNWAANSYLQAQILSVGSSIAGSHLSIHVIYQ